ncbi:MAG TPA: SHOCT domain-containing protein [Streptosporangiaceae bacterium]|nr:SHOCT domain-containing protein [Streptosporangiaceae bacterium]
MFRRRRPLLRAAVVGGGAYMAGKSHARHSMERQQYEDDQDARISDVEQQQASYQQPPPQAPAQAPAQSSPMVSQLNDLAALHKQGVLTDDEFAAAKAKLIG